MRKLLLSILLLFAAFGGTVSAEENSNFDPTVGALFEKFSQYVLGVEITTTTETDDGSTMSSQVWTPGIRSTEDTVIISATRLPEDPVKNVTYRLVSGNVRSRAEIKAVNLRSNVAVLTQTSGTRIQGLSFSSEQEVKIGEKLYALTVMPPSGKFLCRVVPFRTTSKIALPSGDIYTTDIILPGISSPNSLGAPVFNSDLKLVGMLNVNRADATNTLILIPSPAVRKAVNSATNPSDTSLRRCWFGAFTVELTSLWKEKLGLPGDLFGALVEDVIPGSPAASAGLKSLDVILSINSLPIAGPDAANLNAYISNNFRPGVEITLLLFRDGNRSEVKVTLAESPMTWREAPKSLDDKLGVEVRELTTDIRVDLGLKLEDKGLIVWEYLVNKPFSNAVNNVLGINFNVNWGLVVVSIDGKEISTVGEFEQAVADARKNRKYVTFFVRYNLEGEIGCINTAFMRVTFED
ncbi:MAG: hypothetical protein Kow00107_03210 [Planctomycetota bacterium]